jgi:Ran GTPase-activating protein (RanGAP) involved in mRNA processing and transport
MKEHKAKEFFGSASKDYEGLLHKTGGDLRLVAVPDIDIGKLAKAIQGNKKNLKIIDLSFSKIGDKGILELAFALKGNKTIQSLSLAAIEIGDSGDGGLAVIGSLSDILKSSPLESLDLSFNTLSKISLESLHNCLAGKKTVTHLNLSAIKMDYQGLYNIADLVRNLPNIKKLGLSTNNIIDTATTGINALIVDNKNLTSLDLSYNFINGDCVKHMLQLHLYHFLKTQGQADIPLRNLKLSFISESLNKHSVTIEMLEDYKHYLKTFNSDKTLGKYIQELLSNPSVEIIQIKDIFNIILSYTEVTTINFVHYLQSKNFPGFGEGDTVLEFGLSSTSTIELVGEDAEVDS